MPTLSGKRTGVSVLVCIVCLALAIFSHGDAYAARDTHATRLADTPTRSHRVRLTPFGKAQPVPAPASSIPCAVVQSFMPQTLAGIRRTFGLPPASQVRVVQEACGSVVTGFILRGAGVVTLRVPRGGCIDAPPDARFTATTYPDGFGGRRAYAGTVATANLTYRSFCYP